MKCIANNTPVAFQDVLRKKQQPPVGSTPIGAIQQQLQQEQQAVIASQLSASTVAAAVADAQAQMSAGSSNLMATSTAQPTVQTLQNELLKDVSGRGRHVVGVVSYRTKCSRPRSVWELVLEQLSKFSVN